MELILPKKKAEAFVIAMDALSNKFNNIYLPGKLEDYVKLNIVNSKIELTFIQPVPDMVKIACTMCFVDTLL